MSIALYIEPYGGLVLLTWLIVNCLTCGILRKLQRGSAVVKSLTELHLATPGIEASETIITLHFFLLLLAALYCT